MAKCTINDVGKDVPVYQYLATFTATLNIVCSGMFSAWPSPSLPKLFHEDSHITITDDEGSWIPVTYFLGGVLGSILAAVLLDKLGRKMVIMLTSLPFVISWLMVAFVSSIELLLLARFIAGISDGLIFCGSCMYLTEISDPKIRGFIGSSITASHISGMLLINVLGSYLSIQTTALIGLVVPILLLLTFSWMPESPYYLIMNGDEERARASLKIFKGSENIEAELIRLSQAIREQNLNAGKYLDLFTVASNRKAVFIMMGTRAAQQLCGALPIMFYSQIIFEEAGDDISPSVASMIYFSVQLVVSVCCTLIVDRTGRRPLMMTSLIGVSLALLIEGCFFVIKNTTEIDTSSYTLVSLVALLIFVIMYGVGMQTIPLLLIGELFPTNVKAFAISFSDVYFCIVISIVSKFFQITKDAFGLHVPFFVFCCCALLGIVFVFRVVPETKGKTLEQIQDELKGIRRRNSKINLDSIQL